MTDRLLELHDRPLHGPMIEVYARQRAELAARHAAAVGEIRNGPAVTDVRWRTLAGMSLCDAHALGLLDYGFVPDDLRPVWDDAKIAEVAAQTGMHLRDVRRLHAHYFDEHCAMCGVAPSANRCLNCDKTLHPNWPAVYCSDVCALEDA